jgi:recombination protein RecT
MSTDLDTLIRRDDELYDFAGAREQSNKEVARPNMGNALDYFAGGGALPPPSADDTFAVPGGVIDLRTGEQHVATSEPATVEIKKDQQPGATAASASVPKTAAQYRDFFDGVVAHAELEGSGEALASWFGSDNQRRLRNACGVTSDQKNEMAAIVSKLAGGSK